MVRVIVLVRVVVVASVIVFVLVIVVDRYRNRCCYCVFLCCERVCDCYSVSC